MSRIQISRFDNLDHELPSADPKAVGAQVTALVAVLSEINELTQNGGVKALMQNKRELFMLRNENERLKKENKSLQEQLRARDKEIQTLKSRPANSSTVC